MLHLKKYLVSSINNLSYIASLHLIDSFRFPQQLLITSTHSEWYESKSIQYIVSLEMKSISSIFRDLVSHSIFMKTFWNSNQSGNIFENGYEPSLNCTKLLLPVWITVESFYWLCQSFGEILYGLLCDPNIHIFAPTFFSLAMMMTREMNKCMHFLPHLKFVAANTICLLTLVFQLIVQVGIKVQVGKISKINKSAGWNKAMQVGILGILLL